jgi:hypothetical protein
MGRGDGYDEVRRAYKAGVAATVAYGINRAKGGGTPPDAEAYVDRLKARPLVAKLLE